MYKRGKNGSTVGMDITKEYNGAKLGDVRLEKRLTEIGTRLWACPQESFPKALVTEKELEATYRFLQHPAVSPEKILSPHVRATKERAKECGDIIIAHDTTQFCSSTKRKGLGRGSNASEEGRVFFGHFALGITNDAWHIPLGILGVETLLRQGTSTRQKTHHTESQPESERESSRWWRVIQQSERHLAGDAKALHVMDREADQYVVLARCVWSKYRFVVRSRHVRRLADDPTETILHAVRKIPGIFCRRVPLSAKDPKPLAKKRGVRKKTRTAKLEFRATSVCRQQPSTKVATDFPVPPTLSLHIVEVTEVAPPDGFTPVSWRLLTTESIDTPEDIERIVDAYRARWRIEEFFKALKTGCAFEKRQLESARTILSSLAIFTPIAWALLRIRHCAQQQPDAPASLAFSPLHIHILQHHPDVQLRPHPSLRDALLALARLGGHIKANGDPGWIVLGRAFQKLLLLHDGLRLANTIPVL